MVVQERTRGDEPEDHPQQRCGSKSPCPQFPQPHSARDFLSRESPGCEPTVLEIRNLGFDLGICLLEQRTL